MAIQIFYAWHLDRPSRTNKKFIRDALDAVAQQLQAGSEVDEAEQPLDAYLEDIEIDQDTQGQAGLVNIIDSIKKKIDSCDVFVCDLTHIAEYKVPDGRTKKAQNGNVLIELGYAIRNIDPRRIVCAMNTHYGSGKHLPFDLNLFRHPLGYTLGPDASDDKLILIAAEFVPVLKGAIEESLNAVHAGRAAAAQASVESEVEAEKLKAAMIREAFRENLLADSIEGFDAKKPFIAMTMVPLRSAQAIPVTDMGYGHSQYLEGLATGATDLVHVVGLISLRSTSGERSGFVNL